MTKIRCPRCGAETARILWGMPCWSEKLQEEVNEKKVYIGGCDIIESPPSRHCYNCGKDVCYTYFAVDEAETTAIEFEIGDFFGDCKKLVAEREGCEFTGKYYYSTFPGDEPDIKIKLTSKEYKDYVHGIYMTYIKEWNERYDNPDILDGTTWEITIRFSDGVEWRWSGCNAYPPLWEMFLSAVNSLALPDVR